MKQRNTDFLKHLGHSAATAKLEMGLVNPFMLTENTSLPFHTVMKVNDKSVVVSDYYWFIFSRQGVTDGAIQNCIRVARDKVFAAIDKM